MTIPFPLETCDIMVRGLGPAFVKVRQFHFILKTKPNQTKPLSPLYLPLLPHQPLSGSFSFHTFSFYLFINNNNRSTSFVFRSSSCVTCLYDNFQLQIRSFTVYKKITVFFTPTGAMDFLEAKELQVGIVVAAVVIIATAAYFYSSKKTKVGSIDPENFRDFKLVKKTQLSHNVAKFRFALPTPTSVLGLPIGQHISCRGQDSQGEEVIKPYTPTTLDTDVGYFELVIKMYPQGRMSHHFREMREGDYMAVRGPKGRFKYQPGQVRAFGMLAGGSGITPMFQVARAILENPKDKTQVHLIYANVTYDDILLKEEIDGLATNYPGLFHVYYVLNQPPEEWTGGVGFVSKEMIQTHCPAPASDIKVLRCGPPPMNKAMAGHLDALGYSPDMQFQF
ncbi:hypothetical protein QVD17_22458 [Tagetes erecta]|uniref:cytochrome-b5 reductase n=1 Tax=Tagetes erecta TaxID=13708 RepID=A0AAD8KHV8_TARER|nr:hypothetical protein QVD17_22458 [Tagetes erecta]